MFVFIPALLNSSFINRDIYILFDEAGFCGFPYVIINSITFTSITFPGYQSRSWHNLQYSVCYLQLSVVNGVQVFVCFKVLFGRNTILFSWTTILSTVIVNKACFLCAPRVINSTTVFLPDPWTEDFHYYQCYYNTLTWVICPMYLHILVKLGTYCKYLLNTVKWEDSLIVLWTH